MKSVKDVQITKDIVITDLLAIHPEITGILMRMGMHCIHCMAAHGETLEEAMFVHGYGDDEVNDLVDQINDFLEMEAYGEM